ncbi:hypothetical protein G6F63_015585 [Rhizopus arrhizus]|nr:hypothetical protein G6F63_015585 [Rhizopus arrhizus]
MLAAAPRGALLDPAQRARASPLEFRHHAGTAAAGPGVLARRPLPRTVAVCQRQRPAEHLQGQLHRHGRDRAGADVEALRWRADVGAGDLSVRAVGPAGRATPAVPGLEGLPGAAVRFQRTSCADPRCRPGG